MFRAFVVVIAMLLVGCGSESGRPIRIILPDDYRGEFTIVKSHTPHGPHTSANGCVILNTYFGTPDLVPVE